MKTERALQRGAKPDNNKAASCKILPDKDYYLRNSSFPALGGWRPTFDLPRDRRPDEIASSVASEAKKRSGAAESGGMKTRSVSGRRL